MKAVLNKIIVLGCVFFICVFTTNAQKTVVKNTATPIPYLRNLATHSQLMVDGKPFLMVAG